MTPALADATRSTARTSTSPGPALLVRIGLLLVLAVAAVGTPADADLWGHLTFGRDIVTSGHVIQADRYSFTSDRPWVNHEWLAEVALYTVYRLGGSAGLVAFKLAIVAALMGFVWAHIRRFAGPSAARVSVCLLAFAGTYWRTHTLRPQLFSVLLFALLLLVMVRADAGRRRGLLALPLVMAFWVNLHGGWIVGMGVLGFWIALRCLGIVSSFAPRERVVLALVGLATVAATLVNPYGFGLWTFLADTVRFGRADIEDWGSILTYPLLLGLPWSITLVAGVLAIWRSGWPSRADYAVIVAFSAVASFGVSRLDAFFALAVVILLAPEIIGAWPGARSIGAQESAPPPRLQTGAILITAITLLAMLVPAARVAAPFVTCLSIGASWAPDVDAGRFILLNHLTGRMLTWFDWGEYAIWHFSPGLRVSMDGRRETVYSDDLIQAHRRFYAADATALSFVNRLAPDFIWLPKHLPMARQLSNAGWLSVFSGPVSLVFARPGAGPFRPVTGTPAPARCFPGP